jgi:hypothetical protein
LADISSSTWSETAASNNAAPPDGWPEGMLIATANDAGREMMAAVKREWNRSHPTQVSTGTANAFVLTYTTSPTALVQGMEFAFRAHVDCGTNATLNINSLGAKRIIRMNQVGTVGTLANDFRLGHLVKVAYDNSLDGLVIISGDARAGMRHISTVAVTPAAQIDIPLPQGIANFRLLFTNVASPNNGDSLLVLFSQNNGQLYWSNPGNYLRSMVRTAAFGQSVAEGFSAVSAIGNFVFEDFAVGNPVSCCCRPPRRQLRSVGSLAVSRQRNAVEQQCHRVRLSGSRQHHEREPERATDEHPVHALHGFCAFPRWNNQPFGL